MSNPIVMALVPIFFVLLLGITAGKIRLVDNHHVEGLNVLVMDFALPASMFVAVASASRHELMEQAPLFLALGLVMLIVFTAWFWCARMVFHSSSADASIQALTICFPNMAGVGLPIASAVLGPPGAVPVAVALASGSILIGPLSLVIVEVSFRQARGEAISASLILRAVRRALIKPVILAPLLGILFCFLDLEPGALARACLDLIGSAAAGVALFLTGLVLSAEAFELDWNVVAATAASDVLRPLLAAALVGLLPIASDVAKTVVRLAAVPSGFFGILFALDYRLDSATAGSMVIASTFVSIVPLAVVIAVLYPG